jgi:hypothetical protein
MFVIQISDLFVLIINLMRLNMNFTNILEMSISGIVFCSYCYYLISTLITPTGMIQGAMFSMIVSIFNHS